jgi:hypothetical protein
MATKGGATRDPTEASWCAPRRRATATTHIHIHGRYGQTRTS